MNLSFCLLSKICSSSKDLDCSAKCLKGEHFTEVGVEAPMLGKEHDFSIKGGIQGVQSPKSPAHSPDNGVSEFSWPSFSECGGSPIEKIDSLLTISELNWKGSKLGLSWYRSDGLTPRSLLGPGTTNAFWSWEPPHIKPRSVSSSVAFSDILPSWNSLLPRDQLFLRLPLWLTPISPSITNFLLMSSDFKSLSTEDKFITWLVLSIWGSPCIFNDDGFKLVGLGDSLEAWLWKQSCDVLYNASAEGWTAFWLRKGDTESE